LINTLYSRINTLFVPSANSQNDQPAMILAVFVEFPTLTPSLSELR